ncbi:MULTISPECIES: insulinase family protein [Micromonospora]|uniref:Insulinase family protein n=1 Tax=Micromonospora solifontis TaxID=2487138 RepID=A0ABX9WC37_9ACTN|nr:MULTISPECIES: insulinase family protein [Micromonospora]NES16577.1 insulinase family protein [Micromonospora sp. PPF5-17B]NES38393.1 insulinase family protein [Micromonospora solifontis]NES58356.1 insulinase family protein [Micromonospora sp. PPF5-6]RNL95864.1 insulinase family protein [Micromonospora solifontis]
MIRQLEVDGVPTLLAPAAGPVRAGLVFRVGVADETLARRGVTHLLEHLALAPLGLLDHDANGMTEALFSSFVVRGGPEEVVAFLNTVCGNLCEPPTDRIDVEREILGVEESGRPRGSLGRLPLWRHGARDHGLVSYPEYGLPGITGDDVREWAASRFTRGNAVLFLTGDEVPRGLRLPLPEGERRPVPTPSSALPHTPAYFSDGAGLVALDAVVARRAAAVVYAGVLERELFRALRQEEGLSYQVATGYQPLGDATASLRAFADSSPDRQDALLGGFVDTLATLRVGRIARADRDVAVARRLEALAHPEADADRLPQCARDLLTGAPVRDLDELRAELAAVTVDDLREVAREAAASALLLVPAGLRADWAGFSAAPTFSEDSVEGKAHQGRDDHSQLIVGDDGVTVADGEAVATVRYADCAALLVWPDGARRLIGHDGIVVHVEPNLFEPVPDLAVVDQAVAADRHVTLPARPDDAIPPPPPEVGRLSRMVRSVRETGNTVTAWLSATLLDPGR